MDSEKYKHIISALHRVLKHNRVCVILLAFALLFAACTKEQQPPEQVTDVEGYTYKTVRIGNTIWMAENLRTTTFSDGSSIQIAESNSAWTNMNSSAYCWYNNDETTYKATYGAIYNGYTIESGKICPTGWHVPKVEDWSYLREFLGDSATIGGNLKEAGTEHWLTPNRGADNSSGFTALPGGIRYFEGTYSSIRSYASFWSASMPVTNELWSISLYFADEAFKMNHRSRKYGFSIRCVKD
jgi:uncharacterized protein (TIGR02145 family)